MKSTTALSSSPSNIAPPSSSSTPAASSSASLTTSPSAWARSNVAAHHGSLSRHLRLESERRLKQGECRILIATASLELGIDIGNVDLVCQIGSPRAISVALQRVGRAGHWRGAIPKGRFFATTRDELVECAAIIRAIRQGDLDRLTLPDAPLDILAQQIVAACAADEWDEDDALRPRPSRPQLPRPLPRIL